MTRQLPRLIGFACLVACARSEKPLVDRTEFDALEGREVVQWEARDVMTRLDSTLVQAGFELLAGKPLPKGVRPWRVKVAARIDEPDPSEDFPGRAAVILSFRQKGAPDSFEVEGSQQSKNASNAVEDVQNAAVRAFEEALVSATREARATIDLTPLPDEKVAERFVRGDAPTQAAALRLLARRGNRLALPHLLARLKQADDAEMLRRTIGLLVELKDPSAVAAIIEASRGKNLVVQREVVFAIAAIGGDDAEAYLDVVATGHDDPLVRGSAERALTELRSRSPAHKEASK